MEDFIPARPVYATKLGPELDPQAVSAGCRKQLRALEDQKAIILVPHDFPLARAKRIRSKWLDDCTSIGAEVKSRLVATEMAYGNRDDCFAASRGRRLAFFEVVAAYVHALIDELVILLLLGRLGQGRTAVLHEAPCDTRKASRSWQAFMRDVLADADWTASVGDRPGTLGSWGDDLLVEAGEANLLGALEVHLMKRLEVKVLARIGGKCAGEAGFLKRVLR